jgi:hypothetical protein
MKSNTEYSKDEIISAFKCLKDICYGRAYDAGWHHNIKTGEEYIERDRMGERLCLIHSEVSEALEAHRKGLMDDKLPQYCGVVVELDDVLIRTFNLLGALDEQDGELGRSENAFFDKLEFNDRRQDHKIENRLKDGGKKI